MGVADWNLTFFPISIPSPLDIQRDGLLPTVVYIFGILSSLSIILKSAAFLLLYLRPSRLHRYLHHDTAGKPAWALVTGASDGIGKQLSRELAGHGFNVVLHGRDPTKLAAVRDELAGGFPAREFRSLVADATAIRCNNCRDRDRGRDRGSDSTPAKTTPVDFDALAASLADINLTVLINNAGGGPRSPTYEFLQDATEARVLDTVNLNAIFPLLLQSALLPQLLVSSPSLVVSIGSLADNGLPMVAAYAAAKTFLGTASRALPGELALLGRGRDGEGKGEGEEEGKGDVEVEVLSVRVGETTGVSDNRRPVSFFMPDAGTVARAVLARVGCGRPAVVGYFPHALQQLALELAPGHTRNTKATIAANALAPVPNTASPPPAAPLFLLLPESPSPPQLCTKPVVAQSVLELVELPLLLLPDEESSPAPTAFPTDPELPGTVFAVELELLADAEVSAPASMSVPVPRKLARMVALSPLTTELFRPEMLS
ncbi:hypothetical protein VPNG_07022 [Cytospora leucostoma]|uniref:Uncharacterized protein n=1 Tax=Cytospora leucostoma TaxID=1230097 RepID=A0A423WNE4_9PEZI|nr:hypothetical protein VPNG_07022 [Cytospora leucostoma]